MLAYAASKPDTFAVSRTVLIAARPEQIFPMIDDLHAQSAWSPFEKDPNMKRTHSGAPRGKGAAALQFEEGLGKLKRLVKAQPTTVAAE